MAQAMLDLPSPARNLLQAGLLALWEKLGPSKHSAAEQLTGLPLAVGIVSSTLQGTSRGRSPGQVEKLFYLLVQNTAAFPASLAGFLPLQLISPTLIRLHWAGAATDPVPRGPPVPFINKDGQRMSADGTSLSSDKEKLILLSTG